MSLQYFTNRKQFLENQIRQLEQKLTSYPEGHLLCVNNGKYVKNIHSKDGTHTYIPKSNLSFAKALAEKKYLSASLEDLQKELTAINFYLKQYENYTSKTQQLLDNPAYRKMISASLLPLSDKLSEWANAPYEKNPSHPENLKHSCFSGHNVRSKSEVLIDQALFAHQIPFRYECALKLNDLNLYPDFTIRHPESGQYLYWEHFGMMDSPSYCQNAIQKLQLYFSHGFIPTVNLITTYETRDHPLTTEVVEKLIQDYLL